MLGWTSERARLIVFQVVLAAGLCAGAIQLYLTLRENLARRNIAGGFGFLLQEAGFSIGELSTLPAADARTLWFGVTTFIIFGLLRILHRWFEGSEYAARVLFMSIVVGLVALAIAWRLLSPATFQFSPDRSFLAAIATGVANTVKVAIVGIVAATALGTIIGLSRLSRNRLLSKLATAYIEFFRNIPLLVQIFFWYFAVLRALPGVRASVWISDVIAINNRGIHFPSPQWADASVLFAIILSAGLLLVLLMYGLLRGGRIDPRRRRIGLWITVIGCALLALSIAGSPFALERPTLTGFNIRGGSALTPEYAALLLGVTAYTAAFIAEIVRAGLTGVGAGQWEASQALGLTRVQALRLVIAPQALRIIVPPLITQYLSLTKDTSLGVVIGYPELVSVTGTVINQTGQAIEMLLITLATYSALSLGISALINWLDRRAAWASIGRA